MCRFDLENFAHAQFRVRARCSVLVNMAKSVGEVLVEYLQSKRVFTLNKSICDDISTYLKELGVAGKVILNPEDAAQTGSSHTVRFALQQWRKASVDVTSIDQICPDSRLTVVWIEGNSEALLSLEVIYK